MSDRMTLTPVPNFSKLADKLISAKDLRDFALTATKEIRNRTQLQNVDEDGQSFKKYTPQYAKAKKQNRVTLTGISAGSRMLNNMKVKSNNKEAIIYFSDGNKEKIAGYNMKTRKFFGFSKEQEKGINKKYRKLIDKRIKDWENATW